MSFCADIGDLMAPFGLADNSQHRIVRDRLRLSILQFKMNIKTQSTISMTCMQRG